MMITIASRIAECKLQGNHWIPSLSLGLLFVGARSSGISLPQASSLILH